MTDAAFGQTARALERLTKAVVASHENPDGDAIGSIAAATHILRARGVDVVPLLPSAGTLGSEFRWILPPGVVAAVPADVAERTLVAVDCGSAPRLRVHGLVNRAAACINIDHHHDNTHFGSVNLVDPTAACTTLILHDLQHALGVASSRELDDALYVGLVTDTGRFQYANTDARALRVAAALVDGGVRPADVFRALYEAAPAERIVLQARALARLDRRLDGRLGIVFVARADYEESGATEGMAEGLVDVVRSIDGIVVAAAIRETEVTPRWKISLRAAAENVDVSAVAHAFGGGGHPQAAGCSSDLDLHEIVERLEQLVRDVI